ncbi:hypothetical protein [Lacticaseibacillus hulanensis]|jgi:hypothetical protein|uniref:hypothetical protein n=1 Tax=Lacticaseibacillus hulanensis TaxID=2493111 RepID=UPI000FDC31BD|nr:hypothetical protein [Lacticaseibacillus hulanensis]
MKTSKLGYALLSALMLASALAPSISTFATTDADYATTNIATSDLTTGYSGFELPSSGLGQTGYLNNDTGFTDAQVNAIVDEVNFYFHEVGYIDDNNNYVITNINPLRERALNGDESSQAIVETYEQQTFGEGEKGSVAYLTCIALNSIPGIGEVASFASLIKAYTKSNLALGKGTVGAYAIAKALGKIVVKMGSAASKILAKTSVAGIIGSVVVSMVTCRNEL